MKRHIKATMTGAVIIGSKIMLWMILRFLLMFHSAKAMTKPSRTSAARQTPTMRKVLTAALRKFLSFKAEVYKNQSEVRSPKSEPSKASSATPIRNLFKFGPGLRFAKSAPASVRINPKSEIRNAKSDDFRLQYF